MATPAGKVCPGVTPQEQSFLRRGGTRTTRGKRPLVTEINKISIFRMFVFLSGFMNYEIHSFTYSYLSLDTSNFSLPMKYTATIAMVIGMSDHKNVAEIEFDMALTMTSKIVGGIISRCSG